MDGHIQHTIQFWQSYSDVPLSEEDAREINENLHALFDFLDQLDCEQKKKGGEKNEYPSLKHQEG